MNKVRILAAVAIAAVASFAHPQTPVEKPHYLNARIGVYLPQDPYLGAGFGPGFAGEIGMGRRFTPMFAAELGMGHLRSTSDTITLFRVDDGAREVHLDVDLAVTPIVATAKLFLPARLLEPYALAGAGLYITEVTSNSDRYGFRMSVNHRETAFGVHLGAGAAIHVTPWASLGLELRYVLSYFPSDQSLGLDGLQISGGASLGF